MEISNKTYLALAKQISSDPVAAAIVGRSAWVLNISFVDDGVDSIWNLCELRCDDVRGFSFGISILIEGSMQDKARTWKCSREAIAFTLALQEQDPNNPHLPNLLAMAG